MLFKIGLILFRPGWYLLYGLKLMETFLSTDITGMTLPPRMMLFKDSSLMQSALVSNHVSKLNLCHSSTSQVPRLQVSVTAQPHNFLN